MNLVYNNFCCFLDTITENKFDFTNHLNNIQFEIVKTTFQYFYEINQDALINDFEIEINNCKEKNLYFVNNNEIIFQIELESILNMYFSNFNKNKFWHFFSIIADRDVKDLINKRNESINYAVNEFQNQLSSIGFLINQEDIYTKLLNKDAIETKNFSLFPQELDFQILKFEENSKAFWDHLKNIYNLINPYNKIKNTNSKEILSSIFNSVNSTIGNTTENPQNLIPGLMGNIMNSNMFGKMEEIFKDKNGLEDLMKNILEMIPKN